MKFTDFKKFTESLEKLGLSLDYKKSTPVEIEIEENVLARDLILGERGIYKLDEQKGILSRLTLNICDKEFHWIERTINENEFSRIQNQQDFENNKFVASLHRYHFTKCRHINTAVDENRGYRYYGSSRWTGKFLYRINHNNEEIYKNNDQKLYPCKTCLENLTGNMYDYRDFDINLVLKYSDQLGTQHNLECSYIPNLYSSDFSKIATKLKEEKKYTCEKCGESPSNKRDIHCHHINYLRHDNRKINLKILCKRCHNFIHGHIR